MNEENTNCPYCKTPSSITFMEGVGYRIECKTECTSISSFETAEEATDAWEDLCHIVNRIKAEKVFGNE